MDKNEQVVNKSMAQYEVLEVTQSSLRAFVNAKNDTLLQLGTLEAEYAAKRASILAEANTASNTLNSLVKAAAKEIGVPLEQGNWNLDFSKMVFTRIS